MRGRIVRIFIRACERATIIDDAPFNTVADVDASFHAVATWLGTVCAGKDTVAVHRHAAIACRLIRPVGNAVCIFRVRDRGLASCSHRWGEHKRQGAEEEYVAPHHDVRRAQAAW